jgi:hypothetical protein
MKQRRMSKIILLETMMTKDPHDLHDLQMLNGDFLQSYPEVTRVEVITNNGREFVRYECSNVQVSLQDDGQTIKVFLFSTLD